MYHKHSRSSGYYGKPAVVEHCPVVRTAINHDGSVVPSCSLLPPEPVTTGSKEVVRKEIVTIGTTSENAVEEVGMALIAASKSEKLEHRKFLKLLGEFLVNYKVPARQIPLPVDSDDSDMK